MQCVTGAQAVLLRRRGAGAMSWSSSTPSCTRWGSCSSLAIGKTFVCLVPLCSAQHHAAMGTLPAEDPPPRPAVFLVTEAASARRAGWLVTSQHPQSCVLAGFAIHFRHGWLWPSHGQFAT